VAGFINQDIQDYFEATYNLPVLGPVIAENAFAKWQNDGAVYAAAIHGDILEMQAFLDRGGDVEITPTMKNVNNASFESDMTPLLIAARWCQYDLMIFLLRKGAKVDDRTLETTLRYGSYADVSGKFKSSNIVQILLDHGSVITPRVLYNSSGLFEEYGLLLSRVDDVNFIYDYFDGKNALHLAVEAGHLAATQILLDRGSKTDVPILAGETALDKAVRLGFIEIADLLRSKGANYAPIPEGWPVPPYISQDGDFFIGKPYTINYFNENDHLNTCEVKVLGCDPVFGYRVNSYIGGEYFVKDLSKDGEAYGDDTGFLGFNDKRVQKYYDATKSLPLVCSAYLDDKQHDPEIPHSPLENRDLVYLLNNSFYLSTFTFKSIVLSNPYCTVMDYDSSKGYLMKVRGYGYDGSEEILFCWIPVVEFENLDPQSFSNSRLGLMNRWLSATKDLPVVNSNSADLLAACSAEYADWQQKGRFLLAAKLGEIDEILSILDSSTNIHELLNEGEITPLWIAAANFQSEVVKMLVARGAKVDRACKGQSPLYAAIYRACSWGDDAKVQKINEMLPALIDGEVDPDPDGYALLKSYAYVSFFNGLHDIAEKLLDRWRHADAKPDYDTSILMLAIRRGDVNFTRKSTTQHKLPRYNVLWRKAM
jgi:ankyrin repeat protein